MMTSLHVNGKVNLRLEVNPPEGGTNRELRLGIEDNGRGFDSRHPSDGIGLRAMREQTEKLGGLLEIESRPGEGSRISVFLPYPLAQR